MIEIVLGLKIHSFWPPKTWIPCKFGNVNYCIDGQLYLAAAIIDRIGIDVYWSHNASIISTISTIVNE